MDARIAHLITASNQPCAAALLPTEGLTEAELVEREAAITEEMATRFKHAASAAAQFQTLTSGEKRLLIAAALRSNKLFLALASGEWNLAVRALRGHVAANVDEAAQASYRELIVKLDCMTTVDLDGEVVIMEARRQSAPAAA